MIDIDFEPDFASPQDWANYYRRLGLSCVPATVSADGKKKHPVASWGEFQQALVPQNVHDKWYGPNGTHKRESTMGFITGRASIGNGYSLLLIDVDTKEGKRGDVTWSNWLKEYNNGIDIETWTATTGSGGRHLYFKYPSSVAIHNTQETHHGIDVRAQGGFVMAPPSRHYVKGKFYEWANGFAPWETELSEAPDWLIDITVMIGDYQISKIKRTKTDSPEDCIDAFGNRIDGREKYMADMVFARVVDMRRSGEQKPSVERSEEIAAALFETFKLKVKSRVGGDGDIDSKLASEGRGLPDLREKLKRQIKGWDAHILEAALSPPAEMVDRRKMEASKGSTDAVEWLTGLAKLFSEHGKEAEAKAILDDLPKQETGGSTADRKDRPTGIFEYLDIAAIKTLPDPKWLVDGLVIENATGFIYGPPGCGKTFVSLSMALSLTVAMPDWWGRKIERSGPVVYISSEGQGDMKFRIAAWEHANQVLADGSPFYLIRETINFMDAHDVSRLVETVAAIVAETGAAPAAVFVDTVSRVLPGADENLQKDMTLFIKACDTVRQKFGCCVIGVHHTSRAGNLRGSTVIDGAGDFILSVEREEGETVGKIRATKIKAAADGWEEAFKLTQIAVSVSKSSLVAEPTKEAPQAEKQAAPWLPDRDTCRRILVKIDEAWTKGEPFSSYPNTAKDGRYVVPILASEYNMKREHVERLIEEWLLPGRFLKVEMRDAKAKLKGLKVASWDGF